MAVIPATTAFSWIPTVAYQAIKPFMYKGMTGMAKIKTKVHYSKRNYRTRSAEMRRSESLYNEGTNVYLELGVVKEKIKVLKLKL